MHCNKYGKNRLAMEFLEETDFGNELIEKLTKVKKKKGKEICNIVHIIILILCLADSMSLTRCRF